MRFSRGTENRSRDHLLNIVEDNRRVAWLKQIAPSTIGTAQVEEWRERTQHPMFTLDERIEIDRLQRKHERRVKAERESRRKPGICHCARKQNEDGLCWMCDPMD